MRRLKYFQIVILGAILFSCVSTKSTSILYSDKYDKSADMTSVTIFPYGMVNIPGKWTKTKEVDVSGQYFFSGQDSVTVAVALQPWDKFEFSKNNPQVTQANFVRKFYEWDANYLKEQTNGQLKIVKESKDMNFLIWNLTSEIKLSHYFLFGLKGKIAYNLYVKTDKWDEDKKVKFLELMYSE